MELFHGSKAKKSTETIKATKPSDPHPADHLRFYRYHRDRIIFSQFDHIKGCARLANHTPITTP